MNEHPDFVKNALISTIDEMSNHIETFVKKPGRDFSRKRVFDFPTMLKFILSLGSSTISSEIFRFFSYENFPTTPAFVQQRTKILPEAFQYLFRAFHASAAPKPKLFHGYQLLAADGSKAIFPYNARDEAACHPKDHYNALHLNTLYDLCSKYYVDAKINPETKAGEPGAAVEMIERISDKNPVILVADRGYENYNLFAHAEERLFDYVIRIKDRESNGMLSGIELPDEDEFDVERRVILTRHSTGPALINRKTYKLLSQKTRFDYITDLNAPDYELTIRFVRFRVAPDKYYALATSLTAEDMPVEMLKEIYRLRWGIETSYRWEKHVLGLEAVHSKKLECIMQEIYAQLIMYNFSMYIAAGLQPEQKKRKHPVQINYTQALKICMYFFRLAADISPPDIEALILQFVLPVRRGRSYQRKAATAVGIGFNYRLA